MNLTVTGPENAFTFILVGGIGLKVTKYTLLTQEQKANAGLTRYCMNCRKKMSLHLFR